MLNTVLEGTLWMLVALFFVSWAVIAVRGVAYFRLKDRLARTEMPPVRRTEVLARARVGVISLFLGAFGIMVVAIILMGVLNTIAAPGGGA